MYFLIFKIAQRNCNLTDHVVFLFALIFELNNDILCLEFQAQIHMLDKSRTTQGKDWICSSLYIISKNGTIRVNFFFIGKDLFEVQHPR